MSRLHVIPAQGDPFDFPLSGEGILIGRNPDVDLTLADAGLSRVHARIFHQTDGWFAEDMESANGTLVNGQRVERATRLQHGDELRLSDCRILFQEEEEAREPAVKTTTSQETVFRRISDLVEDHPMAVDSSRLKAPDDLRRKADRLELLVGVHQALSRSIELQELLELILERAFDHLQPEEGVIFLRSGEGEYFRAAYRSQSGDESQYVYSRTLISEVAEKGLAALVLDVGADERFAGAESIQASGIRSLVAAPLLDAEGPLGMIALSSRFQTRRFEESDMELLAALASVAALRIRNVALADEAAERKRLEQELKVARDIQNAVLPASLPEVEGYELFGVNLPSRGVSGDYYKAFVRKQGSELAVMIADVCGKGMAAALLTASLEALAAGPIEDGQSVEEICNKVCRRLYERTPITKFATAFLVIIEVASGRVHYINAGHNPALLLRSTGEVELLESKSVPVGVMPDAGYTEQEANLNPGDLLILYTDGIAEAADPDGHQYGLERLMEVCLEQRSVPLADMATTIDSDVSAFARGVPFADDRTMVLLRRQAAGT